LISVSKGLVIRRNVFGKKVYWYSRIDSTMNVAYLFAKQGAEEGTIVVAEEQSRGKGRAEHQWFSPPGGLWFSLILRPCVSSSLVPRLSILGAVGIVETVKEMSPRLFPQIRWPNDALINGRKVGGVICRARLEQNRVNFVVMGIGVNLNVEHFPPPFSFAATSLKRETGHFISEGAFLANLSMRLEELYFSSQRDFSQVLEKARFFSSLLGRQVKIKANQEEFTGWAQDLDEEGNLILRLESGVMRRISPEEGYVNSSGAQ